MKHRVVITGIGIHSCIGESVEEVATSLYQGRSGIGLDPVRKEAGYMSGLTGIVSTPDLKGRLGRRERITLGQPGIFAYLATEQALAQAGITPDYLAAHEVGILFGNDSCAEAVVRSADVIREKRNTQMAGTGAVFQSLDSTVTMNLSVLYNLRGINMTIAAACASGSHPIGLAWLLIGQGLQECIICGGAQEVNPLAVASFDGLGAFSKREDAPTEASRPFDADRDGLVPSGGGATLIVESLESAKRRGAKVIAEVLGYGFSSNGDHLSVPNAIGPAVSLRRCLDSAGLRVEDVDYINAHATSTPVGDAVEAKAIKDVLGGHRAVVTSTKAFTGHEMWMSGASEAIYSLIMMERDFIAANLNLHRLDPAAEGLCIPPERIDRHFDTFVSNSFGFGGTNSTLAFRRFRE